MFYGTLGATFSLVTFKKANQLNVIGEEISISVIKVGGEKETVPSYACDLPLGDRPRGSILARPRANFADSTCQFWLVFAWSPFQIFKKVRIIPRPKFTNLNFRLPTIYINRLTRKNLKPCRPGKVIIFRVYGIDKYLQRSSISVLKVFFIYSMT